MYIILGENEYLFIMHAAVHAVSFILILKPHEKEKMMSKLKFKFPWKMISQISVWEVCFDTNVFCLVVD